MIQTYIPFISLATGIIAFIYGLLKRDRKSALRQTGCKVEGIIFAIENNYDSSLENEIVSQFGDNSKKIMVRFVTDTLLWITAPIDQDFRIFFSWQYKAGEKVTIFYDRDDPNSFYVDSKQSSIIGRLFIILGAIGLIAFGLQQMTKGG